MPTLKRKRNASVTRENILVAARKVFTDKGFEGAGLREIAALADINVALINRYFGSKQSLFEEAIIAPLDLNDLFGDDMSTFGTRVAATLMSHPIKKEGYDPTLAILRSASSNTSVSVITEAMNDAFVKVLIEKLSTETRASCEAKAGMLLSVMLGFDMMRRIFQIDVLSLEADQDATALLATSLQAIIDA